MTDPQQAALSALLATHAAVLQPLLGDLWPVRPFKVEQFGPLTKYTLGQMPSGEWAMLHLVTAPDNGDAHCHPCKMRSFGIDGTYIEEKFTPLPEGGYQLERFRRAAGGHHIIEADCIHRLVALPDGPCLTLVFAGPVVREWRHYDEAELRGPAVPHSKYHTNSEAIYSG